MHTLGSFEIAAVYVFHPVEENMTYQT